LDKELVLNDPEAAAAGLKRLGVDIPNYYHLFGEGLEGQNLSLPNTLAQNERDLAQVLRFADAANIPTVFILPGVINAGQSRDDAARVSAASLKALLAVAQDFEADICIEPHVHSWAESPERVLKLIEQTGIKLALDYSHFACLGYRQDEIDVLAPHALHEHLRQARMGVLQAKMAEGTLNFPAMFGALRGAGYTGALAIENVHQAYMNTLFDDVLTETILMRDCFRDWEKGL
jgi:sugar phosphate isomerase/epimerase